MELTEAEVHVHTSQECEQELKQWIQSLSRGLINLMVLMDHDSKYSPPRTAQDAMARDLSMNTERRSSVFAS
jgi:hypothetical protein